MPWADTSSRHRPEAPLCWAEGGQEGGRFWEVCQPGKGVGLGCRNQASAPRPRSPGLASAACSVLHLLYRRRRTKEHIGRLELGVCSGLYSSHSCICICANTVHVGIDKTLHKKGLGCNCTLVCIQILLVECFTGVRAGGALASR